MQRIWKRTLAVLLAIILLVGTAPAAGLAGIADWLSVTAAAKTFSGTCGENVVWTASSGILTISGFGEMTKAAGGAGMGSSDYASIHTVVICEGVTGISAYDTSFGEFENLDTAIIPNSVVSIGDRAFRDCKSLASITIPNSVVSIGERAFEGCKSLASITIPDSVTSIGEYAFWRCTSLTGITIPDSVTSIGEHAFSGCTSLADIKISDSVTSINDCTFSGCTSLASVTIPNSVTEIGVGAFYGCTSLTSVTIPDNVTTVGNGAFEECANLTNIEIGKGLQTIAPELRDWETGLFLRLYGCESLTSFTVSPENPYFCSEGGVLYDKGKTTLVRYPTGCSEASFIIPDGVKHIGTNAFYCSALTDVTVPDSLRTVGDYSFHELGIENMILPNGVTKIGDYAFDGTNLKRITMPNSVTEIGECAFANCEKLESVTLSDSITTIPGGAFEACLKLKSITIPDNVTFIDEDAFHYCKCLTCVILPDKVTEIGEGAFFACDSLKFVHIPSGIATIGEIAFYECGYICSDSPNSKAREYAEKYGIEFRVCEGHEPPHEHEYVSVVTSAPTCTAPGVRTFTCTTCGDSYTETIEKLPHTPQDVNEPATCTAAGRQYQTCAVCGVTLGEITVLPRLDHVPAESVKENETPATCTDAGKYDEVVYCKDCGTEISRRSVDAPALGHSFTQYVYNNDATTEKDGTKTAKCNRCDATDTIPAPGTKIVPAIAIRNYVESKTVDYRTTITFTADVTNAVPGGTVHWFVDGQEKGTGDTFTWKEAKQTYTVQAKYMKDGASIAESLAEKVNVKTGFFARLKAFFRALFGRLPKVVQEYLGVEIIDRVP